LARKLTRRQAESEALLEHLQTCGSNVSQQVMEQAVDVLGLARTALANALKFSQSLPLPVLVNMEAGAPLRSLLLDEELVYSLRSDDDSISGKWVGKLMRQLSLVLDRLKRVHFKSLGAILALQERLSAAWMARCEPRPVTVNHGEAP
jgi:hypothetical protein